MQCNRDHDLSGEFSVTWIMYLHLHLVQRQIAPSLQVLRTLFNVAAGKTSGGLDEKKLIWLLLKAYLLRVLPAALLPTDVLVSKAVATA